jgi:hypothetical protein
MLDRNSPAIRKVHHEWPERLGVAKLSYLLDSHGANVNEARRKATAP